MKINAHNYSHQQQRMKSLSMYFSQLLFQPFSEWPPVCQTFEACKFQYCRSEFDSFQLACDYRLYKKLLLHRLSLEVLVKLQLCSQQRWAAIHSAFGLNPGLETQLLLYALWIVFHNCLSPLIILWCEIKWSIWNISGVSNIQHEFGGYNKMEFRIPEVEQLYKTIRSQVCLWMSRY